MGTSKESILKSLLVLNFSKINFLRNNKYDVIISQQLTSMRICDVNRKILRKH